MNRVFAIGLVLAAIAFMVFVAFPEPGEWTREALGIRTVRKNQWGGTTLFPDNTRSYSLSTGQGDAVLDLEDVEVVFRGTALSGQSRGRSSGRIQIYGSGESRGGTGSDERTFTHSYSNGVCTLTYAGQTLKLSDRGRVLTCGDRRCDLRGGKKSIEVSAERGAVELKHSVDSKP